MILYVNYVSNTKHLYTTLYSFIIFVNYIRLITLKGNVSEQMT